MIFTILQQNNIYKQNKSFIYLKFNYFEVKKRKKNLHGLVIKSLSTVQKRQDLQVFVTRDFIV